MLVTLRRSLLSLALLLAALPAARAQDAAPATPAWPRTFTDAGQTVVLYQPQIDDWTNHAKLRFRCAVAATPAGATAPSYGVAAITADTFVDNDAGTVIMTNLQPDIRFPDAPATTAATATSMVQGLIAAHGTVTIELAKVLAYLHGQAAKKGDPVGLAPPPIHYSDVPAILVVFMGQPQFKPVPNTPLQFAVNTNWPVFLDEAHAQFYLLDGDSWLQAGDLLKGPWTAVAALPPALTQLPTTGNWQDVSRHVPGSPFAKVPLVVTSTVPAELIVTDGPPLYAQIPDTRLMAVTNTEQQLVMDVADNTMYFLVAGRWFSAPSPGGPWTAASANLPADFAKIPPDCAQAGLLASVPGTQQAEDAVLLAQVPHRATVTIAGTTISVPYDGTQQFRPIAGTPMQFAVNTAYEVVLAEGQYYCCHQGVWFIAPTPNGEWTVCTFLPAVIATIPPTCPIYNVTCVQIYDSTPTTVETGYTSGYCGEYVGTTGTLVFGAGLAVGAVIADSGCWYPCTPCYYSYGCAAHYDTAAGGYCRGASCYGPYGGAGCGAAYNPSTGTWSRAAYASGPAGSASVHQAYNPFTNTFASHASASNGYQSWGSSVVTQGSKWAAAGHQTSAAGVTHGWAETSSGFEARGVQGSGGNAAVATNNGDLYASHDGNVYQRTDDGWQQHTSSGWQSAPTTRPEADSSWESRSTWGGAQAASGGGGGGGWNSSGGWNSPVASGGAAAAAGEGARATGGGGWNGGGGFSQQAAQSPWANHDVQSGLNSDAWARGAGNAGGFGGGQRSFGGRGRR